MTRRIWLSTSLIVAGLAFSPLQAASSKEFPKTYFVDVEGGQPPSSSPQPGNPCWLTLACPGSKAVTPTELLPLRGVHRQYAESRCRHYLLLTARPDGEFEVLNSRTGKTKQYPAR